MSREEMIEKLESFCKNHKLCDDYPACPLYNSEWDCDFSALTDSELEKEYNEVFGRKITIPADATNGEVIKACFPNAELIRQEEHGFSYVYFTPDSDGSSWQIREEWCNAPYKAESEE